MIPNFQIIQRLVNSGAVMPTGDKQPPVSAKRVPLRELPNENRNIITNPRGRSPLTKGTGLIADNVKLSGTKRRHSDSLSDSSTLQPSGDHGADGHLVYVRRELGTKPDKASTFENLEGSDSLDLKKYGKDGIKEPKAQLDQTQVPKSTTLPVSAPIPVASRITSSEGLSLHDFVEVPVTGLGAKESISMVTNGIPVQVDPQTSSNMDWKERSLRLQMFLKSWGQSSPEDYIQKLRSLSAAGRSRLAVELEKRAIQLLLEEGKELHRMKVLNVLGKALPKDNTVLSTPNSSIER